MTRCRRKQTTESSRRAVPCHTQRDSAPQSHCCCTYSCECSWAACKCVDRSRVGSNGQGEVVEDGDVAEGSSSVLNTQSMRNPRQPEPTPQAGRHSLLARSRATHLCHHRLSEYGGRRTRVAMEHPQPQAATPSLETPRPLHCFPLRLCPMPVLPHSTWRSYVAYLHLVTFQLPEPCRLAHLALGFRDHLPLLARAW